jgi:hypothetical protein
MVLPASAAFADDGDDLVLLTNGGRLRGVVVEEDPQLGVRIKLVDGTLRTVKPADVSEVRYHGAASPAAPVAVAAPPPAAGPVPAPAVPVPGPAPAPLAAAPAPAPVPTYAAPVADAADDGEASSHGHYLELGARLGYGLPMGTEAGATTFSDGLGGTTTIPAAALSDEVSGKLPLAIDAGYAVFPNVVLGASFEYAPAFTKTGQFGCAPSFDCSAHGITIGLHVQYRFSPGQKIDPWLGVGGGYEFAFWHYSGSFTDTGTTPNTVTNLSGDYDEKGPEYLLLQGGIDFRVTPGLYIGPFANVSVGSYTSYSSSGPNQPGSSGDLPSTGIHEWLTIGVKGTFHAGG